jgi:hypothetical protein
MMWSSFEIISIPPQLEYGLIIFTTNKEHGQLELIHIPSIVIGFNSI